MAQPRMFTCIRRPGSQPSQGARPSNISCESRVRYRISPIQTKSGSAASVHEALEPQNDWKRFTSGGLEVRNCRPAQATTASEIAIHTPPASMTSSSPSSTTAEARIVISPGLGVVPGRAARLFRELIRRLFIFEDARQFVQHRDEEDGGADDERGLRDPDRDRDHALRDLLELPALVDEARDRPQHVRTEQRGQAKRADLGDAARARLELVDPQPDAHQLAVPEGVAEREKRAGGGEPGDDVVRAAD